MEISFLNEVKLVVCNSCKFTVELLWTIVRPFLKQKFIIVYIHVVTDSKFLQVVQVDIMDTP